MSARILKPASRRRFAAISVVALAAALGGCAAIDAAGGPQAAADAPRDPGAQRQEQLALRTDTPLSLQNDTASYNAKSRVTAERAATGQFDLTPYLRDAALQAERDGNAYAAALHWGSVFEDKPSDPEAAYEFSRNLRYLGAPLEAEKVVREGLARNPDDMLLKLELTKTMIANNKAKIAERSLRDLDAQNPNDVRILTVLGIALDRQGRNNEAQKFYNQAVAQGRPSAKLLNNIGLSQAMSGDLDSAEKTLRMATVSQGAGIQVRQNLALILSLEGKTEESERMTRANLPPKIARRTIESYESLTDQPNVWGQKLGG